MSVLVRGRHHLEQAGESYRRHLVFALTVGIACIGAGLACVIHAIIPALCQTTCSRTLRHLSALLDDRDQLTSFQTETRAIQLFTILVLLSVGLSIGLLAVAGLTVFVSAMIALLVAHVVVYLALDTELDATDL